MQRVGDPTPSRVHLDVATDDIGAELQRLEGLGATRLHKCDRYWQMRDPGGLVFCVISPHTDGFAETAVSWDQPATTTHRWQTWGSSRQRTARCGARQPDDVMYGAALAHGRSHLAPPPSHKSAERRVSVS
jgi:hypothetical protein